VMGRNLSPVVHYECMQAYCERCDCGEPKLGHDLQISYCRSSDTVAVMIDGESRVVLGDDDWDALLKAAAMEVR
jgi:hypothetical protein